MKQVFTNYKDGSLLLETVPIPSCKSGTVLIRNCYSCISGGTELRTLDVGTKSLYAKAKARPEAVQSVISSVKKDGFRTTLGRVRAKLTELVPLGYSSAGIVVQVGRDVWHVKRGDLVACAGQGYASHAEYVAVPSNLVVPVPGKVSAEDASMTTIGAIAVQGVRRAGIQIGESVLVIGLGLIGNLSAQFAQAAGARVLGFDIDRSAVDRASVVGIEATSLFDTRTTYEATRGRGFDKCLIAAATTSTSPMEMALQAVRKRGRIVVVGDVPIDVPREPHFYPKELEVLMATSYGPGRYDPSYEEGGHDYPVAYVRWTEQRNMESFLDAVASDRINLQPLRSEVFAIDDAEVAYESLKEKNRGKGVLFGYDSGEIDAVPYPQERTLAVDTSAMVKRPRSYGDVRTALIGAGSFLNGTLLPHITRHFEVDSVVANSGHSALKTAKKAGAETYSTDANEVFSSAQIDSCFIVTRHDSHTPLVMMALEQQIPVFVEKPLAVNRTQLADLQSFLSDDSAPIFVGFNRRFAPAITAAREFFGEPPAIIEISVNAGSISPDHWINTAEGGGRIVGEVCHFIDLACHLSGGLPRSIQATSSGIPVGYKQFQDVSLLMQFPGGTVATINYFSSGSPRLPKENINLHGNGKSAAIHDFSDLVTYERRRKRHRLAGKGHKEEIELFADMVRGNIANPFSSDYLIKISEITLDIEDALRNRDDINYA